MAGRTKERAWLALALACLVSVHACLLMPEPDYVYEGDPEWGELCVFTWYAARESQRDAMNRVPAEAWERCRPSLTMNIVIDVGHP